MSTPSPQRPRRGRTGATGPRERDVDRPPDRRSKSPPSAGTVNPRDEYFTDQDKPLVAGSAGAKALHDRPPKTKGTLGVGTAGDAARPSQTGIHHKPVPPRGNM